MHLTDEQLHRMVDDQLPDPGRVALEQHVARCADCRTRLADAGEESAAVLAGLRLVDHPLPAIGAATIIARARARQSQARRWAAALLLSIGVAGAAYAAPGSPLPGWFSALAGWIAPEPEPGPEPAPPAPAPMPGQAGIAVPPGERLTIRVELDRGRGNARIALTDGAEVIIRAGSGAAGFTAGEDQLLVEVRADSTSLEVLIPRLAPLVDLVVQGRRILRATGGRITTEVTSSSDGTYRLSLEP